MKLLAAVLMAAVFNTSTTAVISWDQPAGVHQTCLLRYYGATYPSGICWRDLEAGPMRVDLPGDYADPAYRPAWGDRYVLEMDGQQVGQAMLGESVIYRTYLSLVRQQSVVRHTLYMPAVYASY